MGTLVQGTPQFTQLSSFQSAANSHGGRYRDVLIDVFVPPPNRAAPMFTLYENASPEWDDFGEVINYDGFVIKDDDMDQRALPFVSNMDGKLDERPASLKPSKVVLTELTLLVKALKAEILEGETLAKN